MGGEPGGVRYTAASAEDSFSGMRVFVGERERSVRGHGICYCCDVRTSEAVSPPT